MRAGSRQNGNDSFFLILTTLVGRLAMTSPVFMMAHLDSAYTPDSQGMCFWLTQDTKVFYRS